MTLMHDMHCHLGFMLNGEDVAAGAQTAGTLLFANTVTPDEWKECRERFLDFGNVAIGFGMHPWWVANRPAEETCADTGVKIQSERQGKAHEQGLACTQNPSKSIWREAKAQRERVLTLLHENNPTLIGEVGLDFGGNHSNTRDEQLAMFDAIASWAAEQSDKLLSIHAVKASKEAFDILEQTGAVKSCTCVFHWFTGPSDLLKRALQAGCYFSCGPRMLATGKGREYVKAIPENRLLLETDAPPQQGVTYSHAELRTELERAAIAIAAIKGENALETIATTSESILLKAR